MYKTVFKPTQVYWLDCEKTYYTPQNGEQNMSAVQ